MRTANIIWIVSALSTAHSKVIPLRSTWPSRRGAQWSDVTFPNSTSSTTGFSGISSSTVPATTTGTQPSSTPFEPIDPDDWTDDDSIDDMLLYIQDELYLLSPDTGIEFDCPDGQFIMYFAPEVSINGTLQAWAETIESGILLMPNNWTSYCGDISDWTLYGYSDPEVVFSDNEEEEEYYKAISDLDMQYVVVVLHDLLDVNWLNRTITFEAYADDFRAIIGTLNTAHEDYDYFTPGPIGNATERNIDFFNEGNTRRDLHSVSRMFKRGIADLGKVIKALPSFAKPTIDTFQNTVTLVNQGMKILQINNLQSGSLENAFTQKDVALNLDLSKLPQYPGWEGFKYQLYQFYYQGKYWVELWRTPDPNAKPTITSVTDSATLSPTPFTTSPTITTASVPSSSGSSSSSVTIPQPSCAWSRNKEPMDKSSGTWWKQLFKIDAEKLITSGELPFPYKLWDIPGVIRAEKKAEEALSSANQVLKRFTILPTSTTGSSQSTISSTGTLGVITDPPLTVSTDTAAGASTSVITQSGLDADLLIKRDFENMDISDDEFVSEPSDLTARQDQGTSFFDKCEVEILDWGIEFTFGNNSATVFPPSLSFHNYALKNRASIRIQCSDPFMASRETGYLRLASVPIGGCSTLTRDFEIDAFLNLFLSLVISSGSNGSITLDYSYNWDPISFDFELLGGGPNDTIQLNATKLGIGPPSTAGLKFDYLRVTADFPNLEIGYALSPAIQVDVVTPILNYTRGFMLGPAINALSNGTFSIGSGGRPSNSTGGSNATPSSSGAVPAGSNIGIFDGTGIDVLTGMSWGLLWTDYTYQKLAGPLSSAFKIPSSKTVVGWLYGPTTFWTRDP